MSRDLVLVRDASPADAAALQSIWLDFASGHDRAHRSTEPADHASLEQIERSVVRLETEPSERLVVATIGGDAVGVAHLRRAPVSPLHEDDAVHVGYLHVLSGYRRRGVGKQLLEAAADWADEKDSKHVVASVAAAARDANRFLARLGLGQVAVVRASTVVNLRAKLGCAGGKGRPMATNIVAARRLRRRSRSQVEA